MNSGVLNKLKKGLYDSEIFWFHLSLFFIIIPWAIILGLSSHFVFYLVVVFVGHFLISSLIVYFHKKADTKNFSRAKDKFGILLMQIAGLLEIFFYTFLLFFHQITFIIGYLVVKSIWNYPIELEGDKDELINKQTKANSIFRIGIILSFVVSLVAAYSIAVSSEYDNFTKNEIFQTIDELFTRQNSNFY